MTEKRFEVRLCSNELYYFYIFDNETGKEYKYLIDDELLKLLNNLHEEKEVLKQQLKIYKNDGLETLRDLAYENNKKALYNLEKLEKENKKLQAQINCENIYFGYLTILYDWNKKVENENKELKQKIEALKMEIAELRESEKDNYNISDGLW